MDKVIESPAQARDRRKHRAPVERVILRPRDAELRYDTREEIFTGGRPAG
jgi:hypothetical protein